MIELLNPTREAAGAQASYAPRPQSLKGLRIGLVDNTKFNSDGILKRVGDILVSKYGAASHKIYRKRWPSVPAHEEILQDIQENCDVMVAGVGDCGSCSSGTVLDGILLEMRNIPSASIVTHLFINTSKAMSKQWGDPQYPFLVMEHPIANLSEEELQKRAEHIAPKVAELLLTDPNLFKEARP
jgi:hypothetical protein